MRLTRTVTLTLLFLNSGLTLAQAETYYVDCSNGSDSAGGTSVAQAWRTLDKVAGITFSPGDSILLKRGTRCVGQLWPKGSGEPERPIRVGTYGDGPLPIIDAGVADAAIKLVNQQHWTIEALETTGGNPCGVLVSGTEGELRGFVLRNLVVHDVTGEPKSKTTGLVVFTAAAQAEIKDVLIDGITAQDTTEWAGIIINGASSEHRIRNVIIRNSIVHHVYGDGIVMFSVEDGLIEGSAAWLTGLQPTETIGTPNAIWTWTCRRCTVRQTEGFFIDSPGVDGGVYDIDFGNNDNVVEANYGHDAQGYCLAVFGAEKSVTTNSVVRYNVCVNNGRSPKLARRQGDLYTTTWEGGSLDGVLIHNNTFFWNPPIDVPAIKMTETDFTGSRANIVANNLVYSATPSLVNCSAGFKFQNNFYWYGGSSSPEWGYAGRKYTGFAHYKKDFPSEFFGKPSIDWLLRPLAGSPLIEGGIRLADHGPRDAFGTALPTEKAPEIGAIQFQPERIVAKGKLPKSVPHQQNKWMLLLAGNAGPQARSQLVFVQTAIAQWGDSSLEAAFVADSSAVQYDWDLGDVKWIKPNGLDREMSIRQTPSLFFVSPLGEIVRRWDGFVSPAELGLTLKHYLGAPRSDPTLDISTGRDQQSIEDKK